MEMDGYVELPSAKNSFANKLIQKNKYKSLKIELAKNKELNIYKIEKNSKVELDINKYESYSNKNKKK